MEKSPQSGGFREEDEADSDVTLKTISALGTQTSAAFHAANRFDDLLQAASRSCRKLVDAEVARLWIARRGGKRLVARDFTADSTAPIERRIAGGEGLAGWVIAHEQPLRLGPKDPRPKLEGRVEPFRSALVMPLFRRGEAFAAIECLDKRVGEAFTDADFDHLEVAAEQIAFALDNALLYQETEKRALEKEVLLEVSKMLAEPLDVEQVIEAILRALRQ